MLSYFAEVVCELKVAKFVTKCVVCHVGISVFGSTNLKKKERWLLFKLKCILPNSNTSQDPFLRFSLYLISYLFYKLKISLGQMGLV